MSIYSEIDRLELAKENLKLKLESKGVTVPEDARISDYPALINLLPEIKEAEFTNRIIDNGNSGTGKAKIYNIKGRTLVWNQQADNLSSRTVNNYTITNNGDGSLRIAGTNSSTRQEYFRICNPSFGVPIGHKIFVSGTPVGGETDEKYHYSVTKYAVWAQLITTSGTERTAPVGGHIITANSITTPSATSVDYALNFIVGAGQTVDVVVWPQFIDLTLMFGAGNEPATVEEFKALFPLPYYNYNTGTLINNDAETIESVGFNQWDEEWEVGGINANGSDDNSFTDRWRSVGFMSVTNNTSYYVRKGATNYAVYIYEYDTNKAFIRYDTINGSGGQFISHTDAHYIRVSPGLNYGPTYNHDICINISNPAKNGTYEPYKKVIAHLGLNAFRVKDSEDNIITINNLKSAGSVYDEIGLVRKKYIKRGEKVIFDGTENWHIIGGTFCLRTIQGLDNDQQIPVSNYYLGAVGSDGIANIGYIKLLNGNFGLSIGDSNYSTVESWKAHLASLYSAGAPLEVVYPIATPIEYDLVDEIDTIYDVDKDGVERIVSPVHADGSPSAPFRASIGYPVNQE